MGTEIDNAFTGIDARDGLDVRLFSIALIPALHFRGIIHPASYSTKDMHHKKAHPAFLVGIQRLIKRLPRISKLLEIGSSLSQRIGASTHELNRIPILLLTQFFSQGHHSVVPGVCPGTDGFLYRGPKFFLLGRKLQRSLDDANSRVG